MNKVVLKYPVSERVTMEVRNIPEGMEVTFETDDNNLEVSDGHHTISELYQHRHALFCALCKVYDGYITPLSSRVTCYKSRLHSDGTMFPGWFIVMMSIKNIAGEVEQISYHMPESWWDKFKLMTLERAPEWDGHTSADVLERLTKL